ncbi:Crp/Fnr family transcriptional regulator [Modicisalibacter xianhensis]|nr:Crp/Fnr family transcriptional regulator [Halomonas xianhensis]
MAHEWAAGSTTPRKPGLHRPGFIRFGASIHPLVPSLRTETAVIQTIFYFDRQPGRTRLSCIVSKLMGLEWKSKPSMTLRISVSLYRNPSSAASFYFVMPCLTLKEMIPAVTVRLFSKLDHFMSLTEEEKRSIEQAATIRRTYQKGEDVISEGQRPDFVHLIEEGWACRYKRLDNGDDHIMAYLIPGDLCDVHVTILNEMDHSIRALTPLKIALLPAHEISLLMESSSRIARALFWSTLVDEATLREWLVNAGSRSADRRLAHVFCEMLLRSRIAGLTDDNSFDLPLTQVELANSMGLTPIHVNRTLQKLRAENLIAFNNKRMRILDWESLKEFSGFKPNYLHCENVTC